MLGFDPYSNPQRQDVGCLLLGRGGGGEHTVQGEEPIIAQYPSHFQHRLFNAILQFIKLAPCKEWAQYGFPETVQNALDQK
jgi:hypothetical protein